MDEAYLKLKDALRGISLTEEEHRFLNWIAGWDLWTVQQFTLIAAKCREAENNIIEDLMEG